jgi:ribosome-binding factor A
MESFDRTDRVGDEIKRIVGTLIEREVKDPRVGFVTVTGVKVARDFSVATIYVTVGETEDLEETLAGLRAASGFIRKRLGEAVKLRNTPELRFIYDSSVDRGFRMDALLKQLADERDVSS